MVYIFIQLLRSFELLWWKANIFNYLYPRLTQVGLVYAMRQQWPSPTSNVHQQGIFSGCLKPRNNQCPGGGDGGAN